MVTFHKQSNFSDPMRESHSVWPSYMPESLTCTRQSSTRRNVRKVTSNSALTTYILQSAKILVSWSMSSVTVHFHLPWSFTAVLWWRSVWLVCRRAFGFLANLSCALIFVFPWGKGLCASVASGNWFTVQNQESDFHWKMSLRIKSMFLHSSGTA